MPPIVLTIIQLIQLAVKAGPEIAKAYQNARELFAMLFGGGIITVAQQEALMKWADEHEARTLAGEVPPEWQVESDPE